MSGIPATRSVADNTGSRADERRTDERTTPRERSELRNAAFREERRRGRV
jgi:hypothetical protein